MTEQEIDELVSETLECGDYEDAERLINLLGRERFVAALRRCQIYSVNVRVCARVLGVPYEEVPGIRQSPDWERYLKPMQEKRARLLDRLAQLESAAVGQGAGQAELGGSDGT